MNEAHEESVENPLLSLLHVVVDWQWPQWISYSEEDFWPLDLIVVYIIQWAHVGFHVFGSRNLRHFSLFHGQKEK